MEVVNTFNNAFNFFSSDISEALFRGITELLDAKLDEVWSVLLDEVLVVDEVWVAHAMDQISKDVHVHLGGLITL